MTNDIKLAVLPIDKKAGKREAAFALNEAKKVQAFHKILPEYSETPLRKLECLSKKLGVSNIYVKDESQRFGLNAFKGLGGSFALAKLLGKLTGKSFDELKDIPANSYTFVTATDGNHGRGVAWAARKLGQKAIVYMPKGSAKERFDNIAAQGAEVHITDVNYDDTVRVALARAQKEHGYLVQDTAWEGYEDVPLSIMQGYMTMAYEAVQQLGDAVPTHVFLQAGVGAMAGAVTGFLANYYGESMPKIIIVEPHNANCLYSTATANDGSLHTITGDLASIMAGLCCGEVCSVAWDVLKHHAGYYLSMPDYMAADGMRVLANPLGEDAKIVAGESGAAGFGALYELLSDENHKDIKETIGLTRDSVILCMNTEGDTDQENYRNIVWEGKYSK